MIVHQAPPDNGILPLHSNELPHTVLIFVPEMRFACTVVPMSQLCNAVSALPKLACTQASVFAFVTFQFQIVNTVAPVTSPVCVALLTLAVFRATALVKSVLGTLLNPTCAFVTE